MNDEKHLESLIAAFCEWYPESLRKKYRDSYVSSTTKNYLQELDESNFKRLFIKFVKEGGKIQSGGQRNIKKDRRGVDGFEETINSKYQEFRNYTMLPFKNNFDIKRWFKQRDDFTGFGVGIATIYLNRIDSQLYPIFNNKTRKGLNKLGYRLTTSENFTNYMKVKNYQDELIDKYPQLENYYKADALNQFIVGEPKGRFLIAAYKQISAINNTTTIEQAEIDFDVQEEENSTEIFNKIKSCENDGDSEQITVKGKTYKRNAYLCSLIKKYRNYTCQFCSTKLPIGDDKFYIEACHIKSKAENGKDRLDNILILCPNCHKIFDYSERKKEKRKNKQYEVTLNDTTYTAELF